jgi:hypothetical protein
VASSLWLTRLTLAFVLTPLNEKSGEKESFVIECKKLVLLLSPVDEASYKNFKSDEDNLRIFARMSQLLETEVEIENAIGDIMYHLSSVRDEKTVYVYTFIKMVLILHGLMIKADGKSIIAFTFLSQGRRYMSIEVWDGTPSDCEVDDGVVVTSSGIIRKIFESPTTKERLSLEPFWARSLFEDVKGVQNKSLLSNTYRPGPGGTMI